MGIIQCAKHDRQFGPHTCKHLRQAVYSYSLLNHARVDLPTTRFRVDCLGNAELLLTYIVCESCAVLCEVKEGEVVQLERFDEDHVLATWPPTCAVCVEEWLNARPGTDG